MKEWNLGFSILVYCYLHWRREGERVFDRVKVYWQCIRVMGELQIAAESPSTIRNRKRIIEKMVKMYEGGEFTPKRGDANKKWNKDLPSDEEERINLLFNEYADSLEDGNDSSVRMDGELIESWVREDYEETAPYLVVMCRDPEKSIYKDAEVQYFYEEFQRFYPDYYTTMLNMGILERDVHHPLKTEGSRFADAYIRVRDRMDMKVKQQYVAKAVAGEMQSINAYLRVREKENLMEEPMEQEQDLLGELFAEVKGKKNKKEEITIEKPKDDPAWNHEQLENPSEIPIINPEGKEENSQEK